MIIELIKKIWHIFRAVKEGYFARKKHVIHLVIRLMHLFSLHLLLSHIHVMHTSCIHDIMHSCDISKLP